MRLLTRREFKQVNKEIDFDDLKIGMWLSVDDTNDPGWYVVVGYRNWNSKIGDYVKLEMIEEM